MISKNDINDWTQQLAHHKFSLFVTVTYPRTVDDLKLSPNEFHDQCIRDHKRYLDYTNRRSFGKKVISDPSFGLRHISFFENKTKRGNETIFHAHSIIGGTENPDRLERYINSQWEKFRRSCRTTPPYIVKVYDLAGLLGYVTKQLDTDFEILTNLPHIQNAQLTVLAS